MNKRLPSMLVSSPGNVNNLNVVPSCRVYIFDDEGKRNYLADTVYGPGPINDVMIKHNLSFVFVKWLCGNNELWSRGEQIAIQGTGVKTKSTKNRKRK